MAPAKSDKHYRVTIAGLGYGAGQIAIKGEVVALDLDEAARLEELGAVEETDAALTVRVEDVPVEHARPQESQAEHRAKTIGK